MREKNGVEELLFLHVKDERRGICEYGERGNQQTGQGVVKASEVLN